MKRKAKIRYAIVGLGHLAQVAILPAFRHACQGELAALISGDPAKGRAFSRKYRVPTYSYDEFEVALESERVNAVFIVLPNTQHRQFTERAAKARVHVLCEKPMATTESDWKAMIRACDRAGVKLMVAYRLHFTDSHPRVIERARSGKLGELRIFSSLFAMQVKDDNIRVKQEARGGPLLDIGVYCINAARYLFSAEPIEAAAMTATSKDPRLREVNEMVSAVLRFPGDRLAAFTCSFGAHNISQFDLVGTESILHLEPAYDYKGEIHWAIRRGDREMRKIFPKGNQFAAQIDYFSQCIIEDRVPEPSGAEGMADVQIISAIDEAAELKRAVRSPDPRQKIKRTPAKPERQASSLAHPASASNCLSGRGKSHAGAGRRTN